MKKNFKISLAEILALVLSIVLTACNYGAYGLRFDSDTVDERFSSFEKIEAPKIPAGSDYSGILVTDVHFGSSYTRADDKFLEKFEELCLSTDSTKIPRFIICLGDIADGGHESEYKKFNVFSEKAKKIAMEKANIEDFKVYSIAGNHDLYNDGWSDWKKLIYPHKSSYYFEAGDFDFYFIDTANGTLGSKQLPAFERQLKKSSRPKVILTHYPVYGGGPPIFVLQNSAERNKLLSIFAKTNVRNIYSGHYHFGSSFDYGEFREDVLESYLYEKSFYHFTVNSENQKVKLAKIKYEEGIFDFLE